MRAGQLTEAEACCRQALAIDPFHPDALHLKGLLEFQGGQYERALDWIARAVRRTPTPDNLASLGLTLQRLGRRDEALKAFDTAVQLNPGDATCWKNLGGALAELDRLDEAILSLKHALQLDPRNWEAAHDCGVLLQRLMQLGEALSYFTLCDELRPDHAPTLQLRATCLRALAQFEDALACVIRAHAVDPANPGICTQIGDILQSLGRREESLQWLDRALGLRPDFVDALSARAMTLGELHRFDEALATYDRVKALDPGNAAAEWNAALLHMLTGNFEAGWSGREARWKALPMVFPELSQPLWLGDQPIDGKTLLLGADEGLGDAIQFARYVPMLAARGARVVLLVADAVCPLLSAMPGVVACVPKSSPGALPPFDLHCPLSSLPLAFGTRLDTIPSATPYLPPPAADRVRAWEERLGRRDKLRVGLVWSGSTGHKNDHNRSIPLRAMLPVLDVEAAFVSLQKDPRSADREILGERNDILDLTAGLTDFGETAALVACLDLVITVDTSVAHLAGALGCPTWILLPYTPDYRWLLDRDDSPWYPTVRLFRQNETRDYGSVIDQVHAALGAWISNARA